jgi:hypothetical protein
MIGLCGDARQQPGLLRARLKNNQDFSSFQDEPGGARKGAARKTGVPNTVRVWRRVEVRPSSSEKLS